VESLNLKHKSFVDEECHEGDTGAVDSEGGRSARSLTPSAVDGI